MNPIQWLCSKSLDFNFLSESEIEVITHFTLLWSFFEAKALNNKANSSDIQKLVKEWDKTGKLRLEPFRLSLAYFRDRYFPGGKEDEYERFSGLLLRNGDKKPLVEAVLKGENTDPADCVTAVLIVVYRLRNNLFHGMKWSNTLHGQFDNFSHANVILMGALELNDAF